MADPGPYALDRTRVVLGPSGLATQKAVTARFYEELDAEFDGFRGHVLVSRHAFDTPWDTWEMHPKGDEVVYLIAGDVDFVLRSAGAERTLCG